MGKGGNLIFRSADCSASLFVFIGRKKKKKIHPEQVLTRVVFQNTCQERVNLDSHGIGIVSGSCGVVIWCRAIVNDTVLCSLI